MPEMMIVNFDKRSQQTQKKGQSEDQPIKLFSFSMLVHMESSPLFTL